MKVRHCLFLFVFLLIPSVSSAAVTADVTVNIKGTKGKMPAANATVQVYCKDTDLVVDKQTDEKGQFSFSPPGAACQIRVLVVKEGQEEPSPSTVDAVYFKDTGNDYHSDLYLELEWQDDEYYLSIYRP